ncbi:MAG: PASTA domain-containing protein [Capnocytophaga sp.]|jgi:pasta domain containing protein|uniref:PASTA domain-containing protein n=1 Tax=Capnocytophaga sp. TaxID=44737 RepID=UPI003FA03E65
MKLLLKTLIFQGILAVGVIALMVWGTLELLNLYTDHGKFVVVPNLNKKTLTEVQILLEEQQLRYEVLDSTEYDPKYPPLAVISQSPEPNERVKSNRKIYLTLNPKGYHKVTVPKVIQVTRRNAEATLQSVGLSIGTVTYVDDIGKDMVLEMQYDGKPILPGEKLIKTSRIDLICGNGLEAKDTLAPTEIPIDELMDN